MIIAVGHKKRAAKDHFFSFAKEILKDRNVYRLAFADAVKEEFYEFVMKPNGIPFEYLSDPIKKEILRPMIQYYATEIKRNPDLGGDPNHWIIILIEKMIEIESEDPEAIFIITDLHFLNELRALKELGAYIVDVVREESQNSGDTHISETELDNYHHLFDYFIDNNGTLDDYKFNVETVLKSILASQLILVAQLIC